MVWERVHAKCGSDVLQIGTAPAKLSSAGHGLRLRTVDRASLRVEPDDPSLLNFCFCREIAIRLDRGIDGEQPRNMSKEYIPSVSEKAIAREACLPETTELQNRAEQKPKIPS